MGLTPEDHGKLNGYKYSGENLDQVRQKYKGNKKALQQIDVYDGKSQYNKCIKQYIDTYHTNDLKKRSILERFFRIFFPDI